jgi:hypothetical protein
VLTVSSSSLPLSPGPPLSYSPPPFSSPDVSFFETFQLRRFLFYLIPFCHMNNFPRLIKIDEVKETAK